jgi:hypothetical protein
MVNDNQGGGQGKNTENAAGQQKSYNVTNPTTGETRTVTQAEWREQKLGQQGFEKPDVVDEETEQKGS